MEAGLGGVLCEGRKRGMMAVAGFDNMLCCFHKCLGLRLFLLLCCGLACVAKPQDCHPLRLQARGRGWGLAVGVVETAVVAVPLLASFNLSFN